MPCIPAPLPRGAPHSPPLFTLRKTLHWEGAGGCFTAPRTRGTRGERRSAGRRRSARAPCTGKKKEPSCKQPPFGQPAMIPARRPSRGRAFSSSSPGPRGGDGERILSLSDIWKQMGRTAGRFRDAPLKTPRPRPPPPAPRGGPCTPPNCTDLSGFAQPNRRPSGTSPGRGPLRRSGHGRASPADHQGRSRRRRRRRRRLPPERCRWTPRSGSAGAAPHDFSYI